MQERKKGTTLAFAFAWDIFIVNNLISNQEKHAILNDQIFGAPNNRNAMSNLFWEPALAQSIQNYFNK